MAGWRQYPPFQPLRIRASPQDLLIVIRFDDDEIGLPQIHEKGGTPFAEIRHYGDLTTSCLNVIAAWLGGIVGNGNHGNRHVANDDFSVTRALRPTCGGDTSHTCGSGAADERATSLEYRRKRPNVVNVLVGDKQRVETANRALERFETTLEHSRSDSAVNGDRRSL